jgi:hypothetical protein
MFCFFIYLFNKSNFFLLYNLKQMKYFFFKILLMLAYILYRDDKNMRIRRYLRVKFAAGTGCIAKLISVDKLNGYFN